MQFHIDVYMYILNTHSRFDEVTKKNAVGIESDEVHSKSVLCDEHDRLISYPNHIKGK